MANLKLYEKYIIFMEKKKATENDIIQGLIKLLKQSETFEEDIYDVNDILNGYGYSSKFITPKKNNKKFIVDEYKELIKDASKSKSKTIELIKYIKDINDYRLSLATLFRLKIRHLIQIELLPNDNEIINKDLSKDLYNLYFENYNNENIKKIIESIFPELGINYCNFDYMIFRLDMELLLWNISTKEKGAYLKANSLRVYFEITPIEYYCWNDKEPYYNKPNLKNIIEYLKLIDKDKIEYIKEKYQDYIDDMDNTGYKALYKSLMKGE